MTDNVLRRVPATLTKQGEDLVGVIPGSKAKAKNATPRATPRAEWDSSLAAYADGMAEGETVDVEAVTTLHGSRVIKLAGVAALPTPKTDPERIKAVEANGGFVNPYTFVPTPPRDGLAGTDYEDRPPDSHARHGDDQYSGMLGLTLTTVTPLLLPALAREQRPGEPRTFDVRLDPDGRPLIHGAAFKGALRSAFETITASRFGVFFEHDHPLAYRAAAESALALVPARVHRRLDGEYCFQLCRGDDAWQLPAQQRGNPTSSGSDDNPLQLAAWVPAYRDQERRLKRLGQLSVGRLTSHHGERVFARVVLYKYERIIRQGTTRFRIWRATHLAPTARELHDHLRTEPTDEQRVGNRLTLVPGIPARIVSGWLSATGQSIETKHDERLFVDSAADEVVPITDEHRDYWHAVLRAYDIAAGYNDPNDTTPRDSGTDRERSRHVPSDEQLRGLPEGTLVYVRYDKHLRAVAEVHPVMIGRLPFAAAPATLLPENLRPAAERDHLSASDRLFGWVSPGRQDDEMTDDGASGYRGRLSVRSIVCTSKDPLMRFAGGGVTLAPLSSPKPTQFRFYGSPGQEAGDPMTPRVPKTDGYRADGGLRGRKMYRWREEEPRHWQPPTAPADIPDREYLAMAEQLEKPRQLVRHRGWVPPGTTFQVTLFLEGVGEAELSALLWLLAQGAKAPLRLGAGKPYGFGVVQAEIDEKATQLWDAAGVRAGWLSLSRPAPLGSEGLAGLAERFAVKARENPVLREATASYLAAARPVKAPVHYPRRTHAREAESFEWFVANERPVRRSIVHGYALPHVRDEQQCLPYLDPGSAPRGSGGTPRGGPPDGGGSRGGGRGRGGSGQGRRRGGNR